jgi:hypothetical protein
MRWLRLVFGARRLLEALRELEDECNCCSFREDGNRVRRLHLIFEAQKAIRAAGGKVKGLDDDGWQ